MRNSTLSRGIVAFTLAFYIVGCGSTDTLGPEPSLNHPVRPVAEIVRCPLVIPG